MQYFRQVGTIPTTLRQSLLDAIDTLPQLWNYIPWRTQAHGSPHVQASDIVLRFNDPDDYQEHQTVWYPAIRRLPQAASIAAWLMALTDADELGRMVITKLPPGGAILPHRDVPDQTEHYDRYHVSLQNAPGSLFVANDEECFMPEGTIWWFDNAQEHAVTNQSEHDRITLIIDLKK